MFSLERERKIKELLLEYKHIDIHTLSSLLSVSPTTVRRDLDKLEREGFLQKVYGGAALSENVNTVPAEVALATSEDVYDDDKRAIAALAVASMESGDIIYLSPGNICTYIARQIRDRSDLTVLTNNLSAVLELWNSAVNVILLGGELLRSDGQISSVGGTTVSNAGQYFANKGYFCVSGMTLNRGYFLNDSNQSAIYETIFKNTDERYALADSASFGRIGLNYLGSPKLFKNIITNVRLSEEYKQFCCDNGITLYMTFEA